MRLIKACVTLLFLLLLLPCSAQRQSSDLVVQIDEIMQAGFQNARFYDMSIPFSAGALY